jgi:hypothetical protein
MTTDVSIPTRSTRIPWVTIAIVFWVLAFFGLCARTLLLKGVHHSVYPVFTTAAENWMHGAELYVRGGTEEFRYSPLVAAFFIPFHLLPEQIGQFLWRSLNFTVFLGGLWYCCRVGLPRKLTANQQAAVFLLVIPLALGSLNNAQSNPLVIGLLLLAVAWTLREKWTLAAVAVTIATLFKLYPIAVGLLLVLLYPKRFSWRLLLCLAVGALLPFVMQRADYVMGQYASWSHYLVSEDRQRGRISDWYRDFRAVWRVYVAPMSQERYFIVQLAVAALIAGVCLLGRLRNCPKHLLLGFMLSMACCWMTAFGPATESSTYILLAPAVAWTLVESSINPTDRWWRIAYGLVFGLFLASQLALNIQPYGPRFRNHMQPLPVAGTLLLLILLADALRHFLFNAQSNEAPLHA